jgi:MarR family transcriptional regulator, lower aerobic nicotinate degradation pathway regulator
MTHTPRLANLPTWLLSEAAARAHRVLHEHLAGADMSGYEYRVLATLGDLGQISQADLGRSAGLDRRDVTHTVRQLETRKFISRNADTRDARRTLVELTDSGRLALERLDTVIDDVQRDVFEPLNASERRELVGLLRRLL